MRIYKVDFQSLWFDELYSIIPTDPSNSLASVIEYSKEDQPPVFFIFTYYVFKIFGYSETIGRLSIVAVSFVSIYAMYLLGSEVGTRLTGILASVFTATNYFHLYYSQELRFYMMAFLFCVLSYLFFLRAYREPIFKNFAGYLLFTSLLVYTHYYGLFIFLIQAITFLSIVLFSQPRRSYIIGGLIVGSLIPVILIPWVPTIMRDLGISYFWIPQPSPYFLPEYFYMYFGKNAIIAGVVIICSVMFFKSFNFRDKLNTNNNVIIFVIGLWLILSYLLPYLRSIMSTPLLHLRYTIVTLPAWLLIAAFVISKARKSTWRYGVAALVAVSAIVHIVFLKDFYTRITKQQIREASALVRSFAKNDDLIVSNYPWHFNYYFHGSSLSVKERPPDLSKVNRIWVLYVKLSNTNAKEEFLNTLGSEFVVEKHYPFYKADAVLLRRKD